MVAWNLASFSKRNTSWLFAGSRNTKRALALLTPTGKGQVIKRAPLLPLLKPMIVPERITLRCPSFAEGSEERGSSEGFWLPSTTFSNIPLARRSAIALSCRLASSPAGKSFVSWLFSTVNGSTRIAVYPASGLLAFCCCAQALDAKHEHRIKARIPMRAIINLRRETSVQRGKLDVTAVALSSSLPPFSSPTQVPLHPDRKTNQLQESNGCLLVFARNKAPSQRLIITCLHTFL